MATISDKVLLLRHPEKDPGGNVTEVGLQALHDELVEIWNCGDYDSLRLCVSNHKRGQQCGPTLKQFAASVDADYTFETSTLLCGLMNYIDISVMNDHLETQLGREYTEAAATSLLVKEHFDMLLPGALFTGREHANGLRRFLRAIARDRPNTGNRLVVAISHSGVIEYWMKTVFLENNPGTAPKHVGVEDLGGLLDFCEGPTITITHGENGHVEATLSRRQLKNLPVELG